MSRIAFIYDGHGAAWPKHGGFDASALCDAPHGLSGTELPMFGMAFELAKMGHQVLIYSKFRESGVLVSKTSGDGFVEYRDLLHSRSPCDVGVAFHDARRLVGWPARLKVAVHQSFLVPNFQQDATYTGASFADIYITATEHVARHLERAYGWPKVHVVPNAWDLGTYHPWRPIPGRLIYTTSLERGFHRLLEVLPHIRKRVPSAHVVVFERGGPAVEQLRAHPVDGVTLVRASSRNAVLKELSSAACLAYPADCSSPTEVFPMTVLEACATGVPVVLCPDDNIQELFSEGVVICSEIKKNPDTWIDEFVQQTVRVLTDDCYAKKTSERGLQWSAPFTFHNATAAFVRALGL